MDFVDLTKGVCIILVVMAHIGGAFDQLDKHSMLACFRMPLYFFISGIFFLWNDKKTKKIIGGLLEAVCFISVMALAMTIGLDKAQRPTFGEALATSYGYESVRCDGDGDVTDGDTPCVAYSNHGRKRQVITVVGDSEKNTVRVYDSQGNLVKPVLMKAPSKKD